VIFQCGEQCEKVFPTLKALMIHQCSTQTEDDVSETEPKVEEAMVEAPKAEEPAKVEKPKAPKKPKAEKKPKPKAPKSKEKKVEKKTQKKPSKTVPTRKAPAQKPNGKAKKAADTARPKLEGLAIYHPKRPVGPAMVALKNKIKVEADGVCRFRGCSTKTHSKRQKWCATHKKEVRKLQLAENNKVWRDRVERGVAGHHIVYDGRPTKFTATHKGQAVKIVKAGLSVVNLETFEKKIAPHIEKVAAAAKA
jgi:hypothetical protein